MIQYDITVNDNKPPFSVPPQETLIRAIYNHRGLISWLTAVHMHNGVHLKLSARPGFSLETSTNPIHHHISILSANPIPYAAKFNTKKFIIEYRKYNRETFLQQRFPTWTLTGYSTENYPIMELAVV